MPRECRLVARILRRGQDRKRSAASSEIVESRCSQLSRSSRMVLLRKKLTRVARSGRSGSSRAPTAAATASTTRSGSVNSASSTSHTPSRNSSISWAPVSSARRVLPVPPVPISVSRRVFSSRRLTSSSCFSRPTKLVVCTGRLFGKASMLLGGGKDSARLGTTA